MAGIKTIFEITTYYELEINGKKYYISANIMINVNGWKPGLVLCIPITRPAQQRHMIL